jgi:DNA-binding transcriptional regulator GbsR (MarR family)
VSNGLKELQGWKLVKVSRQLGDRRDHFTSVRDMFDLVNIVIEGRREREYAPTLAALKEVAGEAEEDGTPPKIKARIAETLETMEMFDEWYKEMSQMPRGMQMALLKMGGRIAKLLPKGKTR